MEPGRMGGAGPTAGALLATLAVAAAVIGMVWSGGGQTRSLVASPRTSTPHVALIGAVQDRG